MTDKERLKEARLMAEMLRVETRLPHNFPFDLVDWLVEQAERVHGKNNLIGLADMYEDCNRMVANLTSQNKRYREALERIARINIEQGTVTISEVQAVLLARKTLEGEE